MNLLQLFKKSLPLVLVFAASSAHADNSVPCGKISDGDLSIPGFSLHVTDSSGNPVAGLTTTGKISIYHSAWFGDHWGVEEKYINVNVTYQASSQTYQVDPVSSISLGSSGIFGTCQDYIESYDIEFTNSTSTAQFLITFQNTDSLQDAETRINQISTNTPLVLYPTGQLSPDQAANAQELDIFVNQLMPDQAKPIADWAWADLIPFTNLEVTNALARFARALHAGDMGTSGTDDFENLSQICNYFAPGAPVHAPDLAAALTPLTTDSFARDVQNKNSNDKISDVLSKMIPVCEAAVARNSH